MTDITVIPQNIDTCWFNSILTVSLFSQKTSAIIYEALKELYKTDKSSIISIFKYIYKNKPNREYYDKIRAELLLFKFLKKYDTTTYNIIKEKIYITGTTLYYHYYIYVFYRILNVNFNYIIYDYKNNKFYKNFFDKNYSTNADILIFIYYNNDISNEEEVPSIKFENEIIFDGINYILDSSLISNNIENHSIAGITYNNERYVYNGQNKCNLYKFDWNINENKPFRMYNCKIYTDNDEYNFNNNNSNKVLIYVKKKEDEMMISSYSKSQSKKEISNIKSIVMNIYDYYNIFDKIEYDIENIYDPEVLMDLKTKLKIDETIDINDSIFKEILKAKIEELLNNIYMNIIVNKETDYRFFYDDNKDLLNNIKYLINYEYKLERKKIYVYNIFIKFINILDLDILMKDLANNIYELLNVKLKIPFKIMYFTNNKLSRYELLNIIKAKIKNRIINSKNTTIINNIYNIVYLYASNINNETTDFDYNLLFDKSLITYKASQVKYYTNYYTIINTDKPKNSEKVNEEFREKYKKYMKVKPNKNYDSDSSSASSSASRVGSLSIYNPSQEEPDKLLIKYFNEFIIDYILDNILYYSIESKDLKPPKYYTSKIIKKYSKVIKKKVNVLNLK